MVDAVLVGYSSIKVWSTAHGRGPEPTLISSGVQMAELVAA